MISEKLNLWFCDNVVGQPWQFFLLILPLVGAFLYGRERKKAFLRSRPYRNAPTNGRINRKNCQGCPTTLSQNHRFNFSLIMFLTYFYFYRGNDVAPIRNSSTAAAH